MAIMGFMRGFRGLPYEGTRIKAYPSEYVQWRASSGSGSAFNGDDGILPVLIVGAGPVGLVLSVLLTKLEEIQRSQPPVDLWRKFIYCTSLSGSIIGSVDHMLPQDFERVVSPVSVAHFSQYKLTSLLLKQLEKLNFQVRTCEECRGHNHETLKDGEILMGHECVFADVSDHYVTVTASCLKEKKHIEREIQCRFLIGTDGAGSTVRKLARIGLRGEKDLQKLVSVHFFSENLGQYLLKERPGMLFFIFNPEAIGVLVAHSLQEGEFVLQIPFYPPQQNLEDFNFEMCEKLIFKLVGLELLDVKVVDIKPWVMHAEVAEKFVSCDSRIILAGDAAHRFPPAGGFGMNTGIQDAHNLAWKLASVVKGIAPASVLHTYEKERRPIAISNTALSVQNFRAAMAVPTALGLDPTIANSVHGLINNMVGSILPLRLQKGILEGIFSLGRAQLSESLLNEGNVLGSSRLAKVRRVFEEGRSLQLQFPAEDLGFRYRDGALVLDGDSVLHKPEAPTGRRRDYIPSADPGSRLPHMNLRVLSTSLNGETFSTLDLVRVDRVEFLLIIAPLKESYELAHAAFKVAKDFKVHLRVCVMWPHSTSHGLNVGSKAALEPWENLIDVIEVKAPSSSSGWWDLCQMTDKGAILIRPDEHIAWRVKSGVIGDPILEMRRVFSAVIEGNLD